MRKGKHDRNVTHVIELQCRMKKIGVNNVAIEKEVIMKMKKH